MSDKTQSTEVVMQFPPDEALADAVRTEGLRLVVRETIRTSVHIHNGNGPLCDDCGQPRRREP